MAKYVLCVIPGIFCRDFKEKY